MESINTKTSMQKPPKYQKLPSPRSKIVAKDDFSFEARTLPSESCSYQSSPLSTRVFSAKDKFGPSSEVILRFDKPENCESIEKGKDKCLAKWDDFRSRGAGEAFELNTEEDCPELAWCASCVAERQVEIEYSPSSKTFWTSIGIFTLGGIFGCFLVPYMLDTCKSERRKCSKCQRYLN